MIEGFGRVIEEPGDSPTLSLGRSITFRVYAPARPQGSKRHVGGGRMIESSNVKDWRLLVSHCAGVAAKAANWQLIEGPCRLEILVYKQPPKSPKWKAHGLPDTQPDASKLARAIEDALTGILYDDDRRVTDELVRKRFGTPGARIRLTELIEVARPVSRATVKAGGTT